MNYNEFLRKCNKFMCYSVNETKYNTFLTGKYVNDNKIEGSVVECGIAAGGNFALLKLGCESSNNKTQRFFWGFDSFIGIQRAGKHDDGQPGYPKEFITWDVNAPENELLISSGMTAHSKENVISNLNSWGIYDGNVKLVEGWIQNTLTEEVLSEIDKIAILRLDMDMHDPTKFALEKLFPKVVSGGIIIIDDWALPGARKACNDYFSLHNVNLKQANIPGLLSHIGTDIPYFVKE